MRFHWYPYHVLSIFLMFLWLLMQGLEFSVQSLEHKLIFASIEYMTITLIPVLYFYLAASFYRVEHLLKKKYLPYLLMIMPVVLNLLLWTDPYHGLIRQNIYLNLAGIVPTVGKQFGVIMLPFAVYNFSLTVVTLNQSISSVRVMKCSVTRSTPFKFHGYSYGNLVTEQI